MGLIISTDEKGVRVYASEKEGANGKYMTYSLPVCKKDDKGKWDTVYLSCGFRKGVVVPHKSKIKFSNAFPTFNVYNGKKYNKIMILDYEILEEGETQGDGFVDMSNVKDEELPFA